jgi:hypothetical protein
MEFERLFWLRNAFLGDALHVDPTTEVDGSALFRGVLRPTVAIEFERMEGDVAYDLIGTTYMHPLVSDRFVSVLRQHNFRGWSTYPVTVYTGNGTKLQGVHGLAITGRCGPVDTSLSSVVELPPVVPTGQGLKVWRGLYFDPQTWDGSDLFVPSNTRHLIVVERVKEALEEAGMTNIEFVPLPQVEIPIV